MEQLSDRE